MNEAQLPPSGSSSPELGPLDDPAMADSQGVQEDWRSLYQYDDSEESDEENVRRSEELHRRIANLSDNEDIEHTKPGQQAAWLIDSDLSEIDEAMLDSSSDDEARAAREPATVQRKASRKRRPKSARRSMQQKAATTTKLAVEDHGVFEQSESIEHDEHDGVDGVDVRRARKEKGLSKKDQLAMHKEAQRLIRQTSSQLEAVTDHLDMGEFLRSCHATTGEAAPMDHDKADHGLPTLADMTATSDGAGEMVQDGHGAVSGRSKGKQPMPASLPTFSHIPRATSTTSAMADTELVIVESFDGAAATTPLSSGVVTTPRKLRRKLLEITREKERVQARPKTTDITPQELNRVLVTKIARQTHQLRQEAEDLAKQMGVWQPPTQGVSELAREKERRKLAAGLDTAMTDEALEDGDVEQDAEEDGAEDDDIAYSGEEEAEQEEEEQEEEIDEASIVPPAAPSTAEEATMAEEQDDVDAATALATRTKGRSRTRMMVESDEESTMPNETTKTTTATDPMHSTIFTVHDDAHANEEEDEEDEEGASTGTRRLLNRKRLVADMIKRTRSLQPMNKRTAAYFDAEAEEEEDEWAGFLDQHRTHHESDEEEDDDDRFMDDLDVVVQDLSDEEENEEQVVALHRQQMDDQDAADVSNLIRDLQEGTLGRSRLDFHGKGYGLDDDDDDDDDGGGGGRGRSIGWLDTRPIEYQREVDEQLGELEKNPATAAFARMAMGIDEADEAADEADRHELDFLSDDEHDADEQRPPMRNYNYRSLHSHHHHTSASATNNKEDEDDFEVDQWRLGHQSDAAPMTVSHPLDDYTARILIGLCF
ncbi:hypothetical protein SYNPS1DRAFT_28502 [Syncephalis pseudoplumigaleata]|uniref:DNA replication checkpoint mediator MRC1 domain-containing protein n=1 Tax=Syncephalis pseudoplumigaleata TaxID=1712513 RepID=A0A4P9Z069_9FUNG|nr:hypothetical protein SYNPS1DRAFT_28502 [Syncephalis pseudoplumigaleata]|eukprot:RKP25774.1 hypothetical protein SYNPS1DRAFT_28502 [Syncephalis pseudoplumigaleata]